MFASPDGWHTVPKGALWRDSDAHRRDVDWSSRPGWSDAVHGGMNATDTRGNNVFAQSNPTGASSFELNYRPSSDNLSFDFPLHWGPHENRTGRAIAPASYIDVSITELFYTCNMMHDLFARYGFDEANGNFQVRLDLAFVSIVVHFNSQNDSLWHCRNTTMVNWVAVMMLLLPWLKTAVA